MLSAWKCLKSRSEQQTNWNMTRPVIWLLLAGTTGCWDNMGTFYYAEFSRPLTDDASDVIPHGQSVGLSLLPAVVVAQIEREPEEEGVVDQLETRVRQGILQRKKSMWCEQQSISPSRFVSCSFKVWTHRYHSGQEESLAEADGLRRLSRGFVRLLNWVALIAVRFHLVLVVIYQRPVTFCVRLHRAKHGLGLHAQTWHMWVKRVESSSVSISCTEFEEFKRGFQKEYGQQQKSINTIRKGAQTQSEKWKYHLTQLCGILASQA